ncbi:MAG: ATP cone domain-containing protein [Candidatus Thermoplasmatota archaeon]
MVKLKKRGDTFRIEKLEASMIKAGAKRETAKKIAESIAKTVYEGMSTLEIRNKVTAALEKADPKAAAAYKSYKKK